MIHDARNLNVRKSARPTRVATTLALLSVYGAAVCAALASTVTTAGCGSIDPDKTTEVFRPNLQQYRQYVNGPLVRRCGTLDCHGQQGRPFRLYSQSGLRVREKDASAATGQAAIPAITQEEELRNFESIIGLEPEEFSRVLIRRGENPETLVFFRKPLGLESHKGGADTLTRNSAFYRCLKGWLATGTKGNDPPVAMSANDIADCETLRR
jgi:hypothetical protein